MSSLTHNIDAVFIGLDVHEDSISVGIINPGHDSQEVERIFNDPESMRRLINCFDDPSRMRVCYEAGPTGFDLARDRGRMGVSCEVIAPSMIPRAPGDRVKTDTRDCRRLARLHRAGELVAVRVPPPTEEAVRDLCPTRGGHGGGPDPGTPPPRQAPAAPLEDVAGRVCLDVSSRTRGLPSSASTSRHCTRPSTTTERSRSALAPGSNVPRSSGPQNVPPFNGTIRRNPRRQSGPHDEGPRLC